MKVIREDTKLLAADLCAAIDAFWLSDFLTFRNRRPALVGIGKSFLYYHSILGIHTLSKFSPVQSTAFSSRELSPQRHRGFDTEETLSVSP